MPESEGFRRRCCEAADGSQRQIGRGRGSLLEPLLLASLAGSESHGYDLIRDMEQTVGGAVNVDPGGLYRLLRRLEEEGVVVSEWVDSGSGPQRRDYKLTAEGYDLLAHWLDHLRERERSFALVADKVASVVELHAAAETKEH